MNRIKVLLGVVYISKYAAGSISFTQKIIRDLRPIVDLSLIALPSWEAKYSTGSHIELGEVNELPALILRPRTDLAYLISEGSQTSEAIEEARIFSSAIADFIKEQQADVIHILEWELLKGCLFEGALKADKPYVVTPYEYRLACPQGFLRRYNQELCSGPDESGAKCVECLRNQTYFPPERITAKPVPYQNPAPNLARRISGLLRQGLFQRIKNRVVYRAGLKQARTEIVKRQKALRHYTSKAAKILPMTSLWAGELSRILRVKADKFMVCPSGIEARPRLPKGTRYRKPLQFGHLHRVSYETGTFFVLDAWRSSGINPTDAVLNLYGAEGSQELLKKTAYCDLIESGSVRVHEGVIENRMDEVLEKLAAVIVAYQWKAGGGGHFSVAQGVPVISPHWDYAGVENDSVFTEGINGVSYQVFDIESLAEVLKSCTADVKILDRIADTCRLPGGFSQEDFVRRYTNVYKEVVTGMSQHREAFKATEPCSV